MGRRACGQVDSRLRRSGRRRWTTLRVAHRRRPPSADLPTGLYHHHHENNTSCHGQEHTRAGVRGSAPLAIDVRGLTKRYDGRAVVDDWRCKSTPGDLRLPRPQRQRQDDHDPDALRAADAGRRQGTCLGMDLQRDATQIRREVGYMTQRFGFRKTVIRENLELSRACTSCEPARRGDRRSTAGLTRGRPARRRAVGRLEAALGPRRVYAAPAASAAAR